MKTFVLVAACATVSAQQLSNSLWSEFCPDSPPQLCNSICASPSCSDPKACAIRDHDCCSYTCHVLTPGKGELDIYDCSVLDGIDADHEAQYKAEFDLLDTNSDGAISVAENKQAVLDKWQQNYGTFCNSNEEDTEKYGLMNQLGQLLRTQAEKFGIEGILDNLYQKATEAFGNRQNLRRLQSRDSATTSAAYYYYYYYYYDYDTQHHWTHGRGGWGQDKDTDCSQQLNDKAASDATRVMQEFDTNGDASISFCEYAAKRSEGADAVVVHG